MAIRTRRKSLTSIVLNTKHHPYAMARIDLLITIRGIFDAYQGKAHPWRLHRALRVGMRTPHGEIEFPPRLQRDGTRIIARIVQAAARPHAVWQLAVAAGSPNHSSLTWHAPQAVRLGAVLYCSASCGARVAHCTIANILREFHKGVVVDGLPVADHL